MFDFLKNNEKAEAKAAEEREKAFIEKRDNFAAVNAASSDAAYLESQDRKSDLLRWQQEFNQETAELYHELLGEAQTPEGWKQKEYKEWDENKQVYITKKVKPLCTPAFAEKLIRITVKPWQNKSAVNSNLNEKVIIKMLRNTHNDIVSAICDGWGFHGIKTIDDANAICRMFKNITDPAAYRALNGWTKKTDSSMIKRIESQQELAQTQQQNKGLIGGILGG